MIYHGKDKPYVCYEKFIKFDILLTYSSVTGNTEKLARGIHEAFPKMDCIPWSQLEEKDLEKYDLVFLGGYIDRGHLNQKVTASMDWLKAKNVAFFFTMGAMPTSAHGIDCVINIKMDLIKAGAKVVNHYHCLGPIPKERQDKMLNLPKNHSHYPDAFRIKKWAYAKDHPNEEDIFGAANFANDTLKKYQSID